MDRTILILLNPKKRLKKFKIPKLKIVSIKVHLDYQLNIQILLVYMYHKINIISVYLILKCYIAICNVCMSSQNVNMIKNYKLQPLNNKYGKSNGKTNFVYN